MKRLVYLTLIAVPVLAFSAPARADGVPFQIPGCPPLKVDAGIKAYLSVTYPGPQPSLPPWYTYFPYEAYFQTPAPVGGMQYPNWQSPPMTSSTAGMPYGTQYAPAFIAPSPTPTGVRAVGYYYQQAPSYWYGR